MIARWTARIFSDNKSNPVVDQRCVIANRGVIVPRDVVSERRHGVIANMQTVVAKPGIDATERDTNRVAISLIRLSLPPELGVVVLIITEHAQSSARVLLGGMASLVSSIALSTEHGVVVIVVLPSTTM